MKIQIMIPVAALITLLSCSVVEVTDAVANNSPVTHSKLRVLTYERSDDAPADQRWVSVCSDPLPWFPDGEQTVRRLHLEPVAAPTEQGAIELMSQQIDEHLAEQNIISVNVVELEVE